MSNYCIMHKGQIAGVMSSKVVVLRRFESTDDKVTHVWLTRVE